MACGGQTWENEVYYLYYGLAQSGYSQSVVLDDGTILTVAGTSDRLDGNPGDWNNWPFLTFLTMAAWMSSGNADHFIFPIMIRS